MKIAIATTLAIAGLTGQMAHAAQTCGERAKIIDALKVSYQESHRASGLESDTKMIEIWTSSKNGTWTILVTRASGISCIAAAGRNWLDVAEAVDDTAS